MSERRALFGTDGVRGLANAEPMSTDTVLRLGRALALQAGRRSAGRARIVVGRDTRRSGTMLEAALTAGITSGGADVLLGGELPTPAIAFLTRHTGAAAGAVISASHNPFEDNGVKFFASDGFKLPDAEEQEIERLTCEDGGHALPTGAAVGRVRGARHARQAYEAFLVGQLPKNFAFDGLNVVVDCANGAAHRVAPRVLETLGARVAAIGAKPDGTNINHECGALHPGRLQEAVRRQGADIGIALDGDADRVLLVDAQGELVEGDEILGVLASDLLAGGGLRGNVVVGTVMTNMGLEVALRDRGIDLVRAAVGDRYVVDEMRKRGANVGGEPSGHIVLIDHHTTGDGLLAALQVLRIMRDKRSTLASLKGGIERFPQVLKSIRVTTRHPLEELPALQATLRRIATELAGRGRVHVRFSGTEPVVRVMVEGDRLERVQALAEEVAGVVEQELSRADRVATN